MLASQKLYIANRMTFTDHREYGYKENSKTAAKEGSKTFLIYLIVNIIISLILLLLFL